MAEGAPLLREYVGKTCIEGSNPSDSANVQPQVNCLLGAFPFLGNNPMWLRNCWYVLAWDHEIPAADSLHMFRCSARREPLLAMDAALLQFRRALAAQVAREQGA